MLSTYFAELKMLLGEDIFFTENDLCHWYDMQFPNALAATLLVFPGDLKSVHNQVDKERLIKRSERIIQLLSIEKSKKSWIFIVLVLYLPYTWFSVLRPNVDVGTEYRCVGSGRNQWCARSGFEPNRTGGSVRAVPENFSTVRFRFQKWIWRFTVRFRSRANFWIFPAQNGENTDFWSKILTFWRFDPVPVQIFF